MDPTYPLCRIEQETPEPLRPFSQEKPEEILQDVVYPNDSGAESKGNEYFANSDMQSKLDSIKHQYDSPYYYQARDFVYPFANIGNSLFINRAAIKMANVDAIYNLTKHTTSPLYESSRGPFTFLDIAGGPGGFTEYIFWRRPDADGYGITLADIEGLDWAPRIYSSGKKFGIFRGPDGSGDIIAHFDRFVNSMQKRYPNGVDLAVADGCIETDYTDVDYVFLNKLFFHEIAIGILTLAPGGDLMVKLFKLHDRFSADLLYLVYLCFESIDVFKPASSRPANSEKYLIGKKFQQGPLTDTVKNLFRDIVAKADTMPKTMLATLPQNFVNWLWDRNNLFVSLQIQEGEKILRTLSWLSGQDKKPTDILKQRYMPEYAFTYWNLPSKPSSTTNAAIFSVGYYGPVAGGKNLISPENTYYFTMPSDAQAYVNAVREEAVVKFGERTYKVLVANANYGAQAIAFAINKDFSVAAADKDTYNILNNNLSQYSFPNNVEVWKEPPKYNEDILFLDYMYGIVPDPLERMRNTNAKIIALKLPNGYNISFLQGWEHRMAVKKNRHFLVLVNRQ